jgi:leucyl/phenylalanyl-tRNA---protein transferase
MTPAKGGVAMNTSQAKALLRTLMPCFICCALSSHLSFLRSRANGVPVRIRESVAKNPQNQGMNAISSSPRLPWLAAGEDFPPVAQAWGQDDPAPGLLAGGGDLSVSTLQKAYSQGIFPWYSAGQPILWWSPEPRMVLRLEDFKLHRSLRKSLAAFLQTGGCEVRVNHDFAAVIAACASSPREGQAGTWILPEMQAAYIALHAAGYAHSIETWAGGKLVGGLYCTAIGSAVFGESMFARQTDASKIALAALVSLCRGQGVEMIDCQQNTAHLASLGAREMQREEFCAQVAKEAAKKPLQWRANSVEWKLLDARLAPSDLSRIQILPNTSSS